MNQTQVALHDQSSTVLDLDYSNNLNLSSLCITNLRKEDRLPFYRLIKK